MKLAPVSFHFYDSLNLPRKCRIASGAQNFYHGRVKHSGKAALAALRLIGLAFAVLLALLVAAFLGRIIGSFVVPHLLGVPGGLDMAFLSKIIGDLLLEHLTWALVGLWALFTVFTFYFFRDPDPMVPAGPNLIIAPGHGKVDVIDTTTETEFMGGECQRVSIFLSVIDIHVQCAPVVGRIAFFKHTPGQYLSAMKTDSARFNENVLIGLDAEPRGEKIGVRLIARRIVPWIAQNDTVQRGERISLIQFGSRVEVYLPRRAKIKVKLGDKVIGGETIIAAFD
jgi:phosphatidylserine decarboxylase